jgi:hypothetical protein
LSGPEVVAPPVRRSAQASKTRFGVTLVVSANRVAVEGETDAFHVGGESGARAAAVAAASIWKTNACACAGAVAASPTFRRDDAPAR